MREFDPKARPISSRNLVSSSKLANHREHRRMTASLSKSADDSKQREYNTCQWLALRKYRMQGCVFGRVHYPLPTIFSLDFDPPLMNLVRPRFAFVLALVLAVQSLEFSFARKLSNERHPEIGVLHGIVCLRIPHICDIYWLQCGGHE